MNQTSMHPFASRLRRAVLLLLGALLLVGLVAEAGPARAAGTAPASDADLDLADLRDVDILPLQGYIDPPVANAILDVIEEANQNDAELVVIQLDAPGSISADVPALVAAIRASAVPVAVFVGPRSLRAQAAGSAAALLYAAHVSAIAQDATVGPAAPLDLGDHVTDVTAAASLALLQSLDSDHLAAAFADDGATLAEVLVQGSVTADQLSDAGAVDLVVAGLEPLLVELDGRTVTTASGERTIRIRSGEIGVRLHSMGLTRRILHAATTPTLIYLLLVVGVALLLFEWFQPGFGVAGFTGVLLVVLAAFGLATLPVTWWALLLLLGGLGLFAIDTAIAGFGPVTLLATGAFWYGSNRLYGSPALDLGQGVIALMALSSLVFFVVVLTIVLRAQAGPDDVDIEQLLDRPGIVRSMLNPEGHVYIDGALWRARWIGEAKRAKVGTPVRVTGTEGTLVLVEAFVPRDGEAAPGSAAEVLTGPATDLVDP